MLGPNIQTHPNHLLSNISDFPQIQPQIKFFKKINKSPPVHMASAIFNPPCSSHSSSIFRKSPIYASISISQFSCSRTLTISSLKPVSQLGLTPFSNWNGLRKNGFSISLQSLKLEKRKKCNGKGVFASLFGVGAPEALVIGVVALLVFGPKGLADVAKNLGQTLRAFQPTIRELQEVSREFKSTLEKEIGLDDLKNPVQENYTSNTVRPPPSSQGSPDTLQNSELSVLSATTTITEDSQETVTTPGDSSEESQETATTSAVRLDDSQETTPAISLEDSQELTATPDVTVLASKPADDTTNGKSYSSEDLLKVTEEQLKALASQQQKEQTLSPSPSEKPESEI